MTSLQASQKQVDASLYHRLISCGDFSFSVLEGNSDLREGERVRFQAGDLENPTFHYVGPALESLQQTADRLEKFRQDLLLNNSDPLTAVYLRKVEESIQKNQLLQAVAMGDTEMFRRKTNLAYGMPSPEIFAYTLRAIHDRLKAQPSVHVLSRFLPRPGESSALRFPASTFVEKTQKLAQDHFQILIEAISPLDKVEARQIQEIFSRLLGQLGFSGWQCQLHPGRITIAVNSSKKIVLIPENRVLLGRDLRALIVHELATHVIRGFNGDQSSLRLLSLGLDRYLRGEEGVATLREQMVRGAVDYFGEDRYLAIGLVWGLDGKPRNFRQTYEIMRAYYSFLEMTLGNVPEDQDRIASDKAWILCTRIFRGVVTGSTGVSLTKDLVYREGNIAIWKLLEKNISAMDYFDVGKYDPTNPDHINLLKHLKILPDTYEIPT